MKQLRYLLLILMTITFTTSCLVSEGNTDFAYKHVQIPELEKWSAQHIVAQQQVQVKRAIQQFIAQIESRLKDLSDRNKNISYFNYLKEQEHLQHLRQKRSEYPSDTQMASAISNGEWSEMESASMTLFIVFETIFNQFSGQLTSVNENQEEVLDQYIMAMASDIISHLSKQEGAESIS